ncbi:heavy metal-responsive transcriptional regulator [Agrococcus lahaulensis]|uniref:heavy metal-responsive transcriptional regulator n=1 Tax=Agrococcus TaxID=46352 RepID=UPI000FE41793|nr:heavy metal-responsive transcriptional regulator [Agrococcus sp. SCSIO52902]RWR22656.1 heavy metal-responsive transcriptional regulator [Agrococcus lahaulensis]UOW00686.1 heavy metal-responsive transcriptional regulator [Agrococcus sp. SCSIO52902]
MRIGELAAAADVTAKTIRFYETTGVLPAPTRQASGYRAYDHGAVDRIAFVKAAQAAGLTLAQIRDVISARDSSGAPCQHVAALLEQHAVELQRRISELTALLTQVRRLGQRANTLDPAQCDPALVCHVIPTAAHEGASPG